MKNPNKKETEFEMKEIPAPPPEAANAQLSDGAELTLKEGELNKDQLISEYARRLSLVLPVIKRLKRNQLIRVLANTLAPPWILPLKNYELKDELERKVARMISYVMDTQIATVEFVMREAEQNNGDGDNKDSSEGTEEQAKTSETEGSEESVPT